MKYYIKQKFFSIGDKFNIFDENERTVYRVEGQVFSFGNKLRIYDTQDFEVAYIEQKLFKFLPEYHIHMNDIQVARVKKNFTFLSHSFEITSNFGDYSLSGDFLGHDFSITKEGLGTVATVSKKWVSATDSYEISISDNENQGFMLALVIVIDQVLHDNDK